MERAKNLKAIAFKELEFKMTYYEHALFEK